MADDKVPYDASKANGEPNPEAAVHRANGDTPSAALWKTDRNYMRNRPTDPITGLKVAVRFTPERKRLFLERLRETGLAKTCCLELGIAYTAVDAAKRNDPDFAAAYEEAWELYLESIEGEVRRRAFDGVDEPVFFKGKLVGWRTIKSDALLLALAKRHLRGFREGLEVPAGVGVLVVAAQGATADDWARQYGRRPEQVRDVTGSAQVTGPAVGAGSPGPPPAGAPAVEGQAVLAEPGVPGTEGEEAGQ